MSAIVSDPNIMGGAPCIAGTRIPASVIKGYCGHLAEVKEAYPDLTDEQIAAAMAYQAPASIETSPLYFHRSTISGEREIVHRASGFVVARLPYNYAHACNAEMEDNATRICAMLSASPPSDQVVISRDLLVNIEQTLEDLGACPDLDCGQPNCNHVLPKVRAAVGRAS